MCTIAATYMHGPRAPARERSRARARARRAPRARPPRVNARRAIAMASATALWLAVWLPLCAIEAAVSHPDALSQAAGGFDSNSFRVRASQYF
jgi:hypothetical protein